MDEALSVAVEYGIKVVEDAARVAGAAYKNQPTGSMGAVGCFSFHPRKVLVTSEGGMCTTNNPKLAEVINCLRNHDAS